MLLSFFFLRPPLTHVPRSVTNLYRQIFQFLLANGCVDAVTRTVEREVAAALESVFPKFGLKAFWCVLLSLSLSHSAPWSDLITHKRGERERERVCLFLVSCTRHVNMVAAAAPAVSALLLTAQRVGTYGYGRG
jgi:hypothetical protein